MIFVSKKHKKKALLLAEKYGFVVSPEAKKQPPDSFSGFVFLFEKCRPPFILSQPALWGWYYWYGEHPKPTPINEVESLIQLHLL